MKRDSQEILRFAKFLVVGCINTAITYLCYVVLRLFDLQPEWCNTIGYIAGVINSFVWNKTWVFQTHGTNVVREAFAFLVVFAVCFLVQMMVFRTLIHQMAVNEYVAQLLGMVVYTVLNFVLNRLFSFKKR